MYLVATFFHLILLDSGIGLISLCSLTSYSNAVAPHAGAWIETKSFWLLRYALSVAPHAGAWIETPGRKRTAPMLRVAPHAGAWIETQDTGVHTHEKQSRASRRRVD